MAKEQVDKFIGRRFGKLTVKSPATLRAKDGNIWYNCNCTCGGEIVCRKSELVSKRHTDCGCMILAGDYSGRVFGHLTLLYPATENRERKYMARCVCSNIIGINLIKVREGYIESCGCKRNSQTNGGEATIYPDFSNYKEKLRHFIIGYLLKAIRMSTTKKTNTGTFLGVDLSTYMTYELGKPVREKQLTAILAKANIDRMDFDANFMHYYTAVEKRVSHIGMDAEMSIEEIFKSCLHNVLKGNTFI